MRLVRYLSDQHDWHSYNNDQELFVREFPKIELHVHLDGSFDPDFLWRYMKDNPESLCCLPVTTDLPWDPGNTLAVRSMVEQCQTSADFHALCTCRGNRSLKAMLNCFEVFLPLVRRNLDLLEQLAFDFCQRQWEQNTVYTEVRYSPFLLAESYQKSQEDEISEVDAEKVFLSITKGLRRGCKKFGVTINQILCAITWRPDWAMSTLDMVKKYRFDYPCATVGIDVAAGEEHFDEARHPDLHQPHFEMMQQAKADGIPITIHAGEVSDDALNVMRAMSEYGALRIGHGYRMVQSEQVMELVRRNNVHVEVCPTSSFETGGWLLGEDAKNWKEHPSVIMKENDVKFSLSSDDPAVFHTSLAWQYRIALAKMEFSREDLLRMSLDAVDASFCSEDEKKRLRNMLNEYGKLKRLRSEFGQHSPVQHGGKGRDWRRALSENFADRVYLSHSQYF